MGSVCLFSSPQGILLSPSSSDSPIPLSLGHMSGFWAGVCVRMYVHLCVCLCVCVFGEVLLRLEVGSEI